MKAVKQFMFNNVWIMRAGKIKTKGLLRLLFLRKSVGWIEEEQNQRMQHFIQHMLQWWQSTTSLFWYSAIFLSLLLRVFLLSLEYVFSQTWQSIFMHVQMADLKNPTKQKCTDNIHSHMHDNVNNYKYWSRLWPTSQTRCHSWLTLWEHRCKATIIRFCLNQSERVDWSLQRHSDRWAYIVITGMTVDMFR